MRLRGIAAAAAIVMGVMSQPAIAQRSQRGQPKTPYGVSDFAKLEWLVGAWRATAPGADPIYETIRFANDSTIEISYHADSLTGRETGTGRLYLSVGRVYHTLGSGRWGANKIDSTGIYFVPQVNAHNTYAWVIESPNAWSSTMRTGIGGHEQVTVYEMRRVSR